MAIISPTIPASGQSRATEELDVSSALTAIVNAINGGLDDANLADDAVTAAKIATPNASSGYVQLGDLLVQWGTTSFGGSGAGDRNQTVTFPVAFTAAPAVAMGLQYAQACSSHGVNGTGLSTTQANFYARSIDGSAGAIPFTWIAIGRKS